MQRAAAAGGSRWQQAGISRKEAGLVTRQGARQSAKMARNAKCASFVAMVLGRALQAAGEKSQASPVCGAKLGDGLPTTDPHPPSQKLDGSNRTCHQKYSKPTPLQLRTTI